MAEAEAEEHYEPDYEHETICIGDSMYLEVLSVVGKSKNLNRSLLSRKS
jgi:hypothetical protein